MVENQTLEEITKLWEKESVGLSHEGEAYAVVEIKTLQQLYSLVAFCEKQKDFFVFFASDRSSMQELPITDILN
jgi:hypothetical protein